MPIYTDIVLESFPIGCIVERNLGNRPGTVQSRKWLQPETRVVDSLCTENVQAKVIVK